MRLPGVVLTGLAKTGWEYEFLRGAVRLSDDTTVLRINVQRDASKALSEGQQAMRAMAERAINVILVNEPGGGPEGRDEAMTWAKPALKHDVENHASRARCVRSRSEA